MCVHAAGQTTCAYSNEPIWTAVNCNPNYNPCDSDDHSMRDRSLDKSTRAPRGTAKDHDRLRFLSGLGRLGVAALDGILGGVHRDGASSRSLDTRLAAAQVEPSAEPHAAWQRLREAEGRRTTIIDLYELVARRRGLAGHQLLQAERVELARSVMPIIWPGFAITEGSERQDLQLEVVAYDPCWPGRYETWRDRLEGRLAGTALRIEHLGSTAVRGLPAKPTIDIQISVADLDDESRYVAQIERAGVQRRSRDALHRFFRPFAGQPRNVHVHVCQVGSDWEREHLLFRDYLRSHSAAKDAYAGVKWEAARVWSDDRIAYTEAKTEVILDLLATAETWARANSWAVTQSRR
jgi:GrpB-like predicted nucleotidyltransferase (UPF0157 family)